MQHSSKATAHFTRQRKSVPIGPSVGKDKLTKPETARKGSELIASLGVNREEHLQRAMTNGGEDVVPFRKQMDWCRDNPRTWIEGRPGTLKTMESQLRKHILPVFGDSPLHDITERRVQEFIAKLQKASFARRKPRGKDRKLEGESQALQALA